MQALSKAEHPPIDVLEQFERPVSRHSYPESDNATTEADDADIHQLMIQVQSSSLREGDRSMKDETSEGEIEQENENHEHEDYIYPTDCKGRWAGHGPSKLRNEIFPSEDSEQSLPMDVGKTHENVSVNMDRVSLAEEPSFIMESISTYKKKPEEDSADWSEGHGSISDLSMADASSMSLKADVEAMMSFDMSEPGREKSFEIVTGNMSIDENSSDINELLAKLSIDRAE